MRTARSEHDAILMTTSHATRRATSLALAPIDLRHLLPPGVRDQGPRPLCLPFSVSTAHEATRCDASSAPAEELAVEPLWQHCVKAGAASHNGTTLHAVIDAAASTGQPTESAWPYNPTLSAGTEPAPATTSTASFLTVALIEVPLAHDGIEPHIEAALAAGLPVVVVIELTDQFDSPSPTGEIDLPPLTAPVNDYHAVIAVGAATSADGATRRLLVRNSWGPGWGAGGYGWLPYDYLVAFAVQAGIADPTSLGSR